MALRDRYDARRLRLEATFNQDIAYLFEVQVHMSGIASDRHRQRSENFCYGMLIAQAGVTIAT